MCVMMEEVQKCNVPMKRRDRRGFFRDKRVLNFLVSIYAVTSALLLSCDRNLRHQHNTGSQQSAWIIKHLGDSAQLRLLSVHG